MKKNNITSFGALLIFLLMSESAISQTYDDVVGKLFVQLGGSSCGSMLMSDSIAVRSRSTVEISFSSVSACWSSANIESTKNAESITINCRNKSFSIASNDDSNTAHRIYLAGRAIAPIRHGAIGQSGQESFTFNELCQRLVNNDSIRSTLVFWARDGQESGGTFCGH